MTLILAKNIAEIFCEEEQQRNEIAICRTDKLLKNEVCCDEDGYDDFFGFESDKSEK